MSIFKGLMSVSKCSAQKFNTWTREKVASLFTTFGISHELPLTGPTCGDLWGRIAWVGGQESGEVSRLANHSTSGYSVLQAPWPLCNECLILQLLSHSCLLLSKMAVGSFMCPGVMEITIDPCIILSVYFSLVLADLWMVWSEPWHLIHLCESGSVWSFEIPCWYPVLQPVDTAICLWSPGLPDLFCFSLML